MAELISRDKYWPQSLKYLLVHPILSQSFKIVEQVKNHIIVNVAN